MLHGVGEEVFRTTFGLSHVTLREGAEALLSGKGDLGESLFQAGLGGSSVHALLASLHDEADRVFSPQAHKKPLNEALRVHNEAKKALTEATSTHEAWEVQEQAIEGARAERGRLSDERGELAREEKRLGRLARSFALLTRRAPLLEKLAALASVKVVAEDAGRLRVEAQRDAGDASAATARLREEIAALEARRSALAAPDALADLEAEVSAQRARLGAYARDVDELPRARAALEALEAEARRVLRATGRDVPFDRVDELRLDAPRIARIRRLAGLAAGTLDKRRVASRARAEAAERLEARRSAAPKTSDRAERLAQIATRKHAALGLVTGGLDQVCALAVPSAESVARFEAADSARAKKRERIDTRRAEIDREAATVARDLDAMRRAGDVPTEEDLGRARAARDEAWDLVRARLDDARAAAYEARVREADGVADRLRREAERVARLARLLAEEASHAAERDEVRRALADLDAEAGRESERWSALWASCGVSPLSPPEMRAWIGRHAQLVEAVEQLHAVVADDRSAAAKELEDLAREAKRHAADEAEHDRALAAWRDEWREATAPLRLGADPAPEEASAVLDALSDLFARVDAADGERRRVRDLEAEIARVTAEVRDLARRGAADLVEKPPLDAGDEIVRRFERARAERSERQRLDEQLEEKRAALALQVERAQRAERRLAELVASAGAPDVAALEEAERRSTEVRALRVDLAALEEKLMGQAEGVSIEALVLEASATTPEAVAARRDEIERRQAELDDEIQRVDRDAGRSEAAIGRFSGQAAAEAAAEVQEALAHVRAQAERFVKARLAELVLSREIARYRDANQGPVLSRASALFQRLTGGAYAGLRTAFDAADRAVLRAAREGAGDVPVEALSDGARDQLYLALRIASLERMAKAGGALPLVLDDVLVHFDDARAHAAIEVLADLARTIQVLFFTHNEHMVELARKAVPRGLVVHELPVRAVPARDEARA
jgi:uncharacterized protein YhaN